MPVARAYCVCKTCGKHFERSTTKKNTREVASWIKWAETTFDECLDCQNERLLQNAEIAEHEVGMCELKGTEKQVPWARRIRGECWEEYKLDKKKGEWNERQVELVEDMFKNEARSWFWIEERDSSMQMRGNRYWKDSKEKEGKE